MNAWLYYLVWWICFIIWVYCNTVNIFKLSFLYDPLRHFTIFHFSTFTRPGPVQMFKCLGHTVCLPVGLPVLKSFPVLWICLFRISVQMSFCLFTSILYRKYVLKQYLYIFLFASYKGFVFNPYNLMLRNFLWLLICNCFFKMKQKLWCEMWATVVGVSSD